MRRLPWWGAVLAVMLVTALAYLPITGSAWPREGRAFETDGGGIYGLRVSPGDEWVHIYFLQRDQALNATIEEIVPVKRRGMPYVAEIVDIKLAPRIPGRRALIGGAWGIDREDDLTGCLNQPIVDPEGYRIPPDAKVMLVVRYRAHQLGKASVDDFVTEYREGNIHRMATAGTRQEIEVVERLRPLDRLPDWSRACRSRGDSDSFLVTDSWG